MSKFKFYDYEPYLSEATFSHLQNCTTAYNGEDYFASAIWGAVFLEGFLAELMKELKVTKKDFKVLSDYISHLNNFTKREQSDLYIPQELIHRCNLIREIRNGLVHDTGHSKDSIQSESETILNSIKIILDLYKKYFAFINLDKIETETAEINEKNLIPVFISTVNPDTEIQSYFLELFFNKLKKLGILPVRAVMDQYDQNRPIERVKEIIEPCEAAIVIGLERSHAYFLRDRVGGTKQEDKIHTKYTSSWLHLEAGVAHSLGKKLFVTCQSDICNDGIFDRQWNNYPVIEFEWTYNIKDISKLFNPQSENDLNGVLFKRIEQWVEAKHRDGSFASN